MSQTTQAPPGHGAPPEGRGVKRMVVGRPMATRELDETLLSKFLALPIFASDPLSSVAYATEAAMVVLVGVSLGALHWVLPISVGIALLLAIVALSYRQTVRAYETSGGAYVVAKENLGTIPSLVAGAALLTDYVLTVAVSIAAGIFAITSAAPSLYPYRVELSLGCVVLLTVVNLRGVRESGALFALPTYGFVLSMYALLVVGGARCTLGTCPTAHVQHALPAGTGAVTLFVLLQAFASGSAALTGARRSRTASTPSSGRSRRTRRRRSRSWPRSRSRSSSASRGSRSRCTRGRARRCRCCRRSVAPPSRPGARARRCSTSSRPSRSRC